MFRFKVLALSAVVMLGASAAHAQDSVARLNQLGRYAGLVGACDFVGFETHEAGSAFAQAAAAEVAGAGFSETLSTTYLTNAMNQAADQAEAELAALAKTDQSDGPRFAATIRGKVQEWTTICRKAARDPIGRMLISDSADSDQVLVNRIADQALWKAGWASWQTPYIRAAGDLTYAVAACARHLTPTQARAYMAPLRATNAFPASVGDRAERYLDFWTSQGDHDVEELDFDAGQCKKILTERAATLKATPR